MGKRKTLERQVKLLEARLADLVESGTVKSREQVIADMAAAMREMAEAALRGMCEDVPEESEYTTFRHGARCTCDVGHDPHCPVCKSESGTISSGLRWPNVGTYTNSG